VNLLAHPLSLVIKSGVLDASFRTRGKLNNMSNASRKAASGG
jgi:hypothetical protein